ncbi:MAG: hypothetical protein WBG65_11780 [Sulfurimonadaceae bacterium]
MKKIILLIMLQLATLMAVDFTISESGTLTKESSVPETTQDVVTPVESTSDWIGPALPSTKFNVLNYGLKGDGVTDDSAALNALAKNTSVTNWYFPEGYTFRLSRVVIPDHLTAVFGQGTIVSISYDVGATGYAFGAFNIDGKHTNLVFDGLHFKREPGFTGKYGYGQITILQYSGNSSGIEIRNSTFDSTYAGTCSIKGFATNDHSHTGIRVYNNTFTNINEFAVEFMELTKPKTVNNRGFSNLHVYNNTFNGGTGVKPRAISIANVRQKTEVHHNIMDNLWWGIESVETNNTYIYENTMTNIYDAFYTEGQTWESVHNPVGRNYVYNNHVSGPGYLYLYMGSDSKIYDNYINGRVIVDYRFTGEPTGGEIYNNTIVWNGSSNVVDYRDITSGSFHDNDIYTLYSSAVTAIKFTKASSSLFITDNNIYIKNTSSTCVEQGEGVTEAGTTCTLGYTGAVPTQDPK